MKLQLNIYHIFMIFIGVMTLPAQAMILRSLNGIEKGLVYREIKKRGLSAVRNEIYSAGDPQPIQNELRCGYRIPIVLTIHAMFHQTEVKTDPLAKDIFEYIEKREEERGYIPKAIEEISENWCSVTLVNNYLGDDTRYYWLEAKGLRLPAIRVEANLTNKSALKEIVDTYQE